MKLTLPILLIVITIKLLSTTCMAQEMPITKNDTISIINRPTPDEIISKEIDFLKNDRNTEVGEVEITKQTLKTGKAYLIEKNRLMIFYPNPKNYGTDTVYYRVCNNDKCSSAKVIVHVLNPNTINVFIPSSFSPNGDGINDKFYIKGIENYPENELYVFNRWGNKVYEKTNYSNKNAWIGDYNKGGENTNSGERLPQGTYYYKLIVKSKNSTRSGYIVIKY